MYLQKRFNGNHFILNLMVDNKIKECIYVYIVCARGSRTTLTLFGATRENKKTRLVFKRTLLTSNYNENTIQSETSKRVLTAPIQRSINQQTPIARQGINSRYSERATIYIYIIFNLMQCRYNILYVWTWISHVSLQSTFVDSLLSERSFKRYLWFFTNIFFNYLFYWRFIDAKVDF